MSDEWSAIILAGGVGSRLRPLTTYKPKPLVSIANKPMLEYNLELLRSAGIKGKIVIVVKYLGDEIRKYIEKSDKFDDLDIIIPKIDPLDTADAVRKSSEYISSDNFIVTMADIITSLPLADFMKFHLEKKAMASITLKDMPEPRSFGVIMLNSDSRILLFLEKPLPQELSLATLTFSKKEAIRLHSNLINTGIYAFKHSVLDILGSMDDLMDFGKHVFPFLTREHGIFGYARKDYYWMDAGNPQTYLYTNWDVLRRWSYPYYPQGHDDENIWWVGYDHKIGKNSTIYSPAAIGENLELGNESKILQNSVIGNNNTIGDNSIIDHSVTWDDVKIGDNVQLNQAIICNNVEIADNVTLGSGTVVGSNSKILKPYKSSIDEIIKENSTIK